MTNPAPATPPTSAPPPHSSADAGTSGKPTSTVATTAPAVTSPTGDEVVVRRDATRSMRVAGILAVAASIVLFWLPAMIVVIRSEPGYFTGGMLWTALIATVLLVGLTVGGTLLWLRTGDRGQPLLRLDADGVHIPARRGTAAFEARWDALTLVRVIGHTEPELAFYPAPEREDVAGETEGAELDLSEPEFLRPLDFENDPPPATVAPEREVFTHIAPVSADDEPPAAFEAPQAPDSASLYATPHVVAVHRTTPPLPEVLYAIRRYADGRVALG